MSNRELSPREAEIVQLCIEGLTNEAIANRLGLSMGTVNTYWVRIKLKVGGSGRTDTVAKVIKDQAEKALRSTNIERQELSALIAETQQAALELRAALALLHLAMEQIQSTVWATDKDLSIHIIANGEFPSTHSGVKWEIGKTVYEIFKTSDPTDLALAAHLEALKGRPAEARLQGDFSNMLLRVIPLRDEANEVMGCVSVLNVAGSKPSVASSE